MKHLLCAGLLSLIATSALAQAVAQGAPPMLPNRPDVLVSRFYQQVVARHPLGIPYGADMKVFAPYLSKALLHKFDLNNACIADWFRQNPGPDLKPPGLFEDGLFSGPSEEAEPKAFHIEGTEPEKDGTSRVTVRLTLEDSQNKPYVWYVAAVVIPANERLVVDDVLYLKGKNGDIDARLSGNLSLGCNGAHWVGYGPAPR